MKILVLCTGNICRSPMAEALIDREIRTLGADASVSSAGFVTEGRPAEPHAVRVMADRELDLGPHRSRRVDAELLASSDLVVGMTREHVRQAVTVERDVFPRMFTLKELVRRGTEVGPVRSADLDAWLDAIDSDRDPVELLGRSDLDDTADPMGRSLRRFRACANEIDEQVVALADLLWARPD